MAFQTQAEVEAELALWYQARAAAADGKSFTITTSAGTRTVSRYELAEISGIIDRLERKLSAMNTRTGAGHAFALANFTDTDQ